MRDAIALALAVALSGCGGNSNGTCTGRLGSTVLSGPINISTSAWHLEHGTTLAVVILRYTNDTLRIEAEVDKNAAAPGGTFPLPTDTTASGPVRSWDVKAPDSRPALASGSLTIDSWDEALTGSFVMDEQDATSLSCTFILPHDTASE